MNLTFRAGQGAPPSYDGFRAEIGRQGFEHAGEIYAAMHQEYPAFKLEQSKLMNGWVYSLIRQRATDAIGLLKAYQLAYPDSSEVYYLFGQAYEKAGQNALAIENYQKTLQIDADFSKAAQKLKALESQLASGSKP
jgi:predicted Zn-dependent protease